MPKFKVGQRIKYRSLRGTVLSISMLPFTKGKDYLVKLDNGVFCSGTKQQFKPVKRA